MILNRIRLSLIHVAVAMTLVPINSTLNRVMIKELAISAALVAVLASLPYIFSPTQVMIGAFSDRHPLFGYRRTPYIALGLLLCAGGVALAPQAVYLIPTQPALGLLLALLVFGAWGMGFNVASVSYLSLASELSGEKGRSRTVSIMWFVMITGIILTAALLSRLLQTYSPAVLQRAFEFVALAALGLGFLGLIGLEPRAQRGRPVEVPQRVGWQTLLRAVLSVPQARTFFIYLILLLAAILGQDVLLEPFAGEAFGLPVAATTRITSIWGGCVLVALLAAGFLENRLSKRTVAALGASVSIAGFLLIALSGVIHARSVFYGGVLALGLGTGLSTVSNLSLMLDMTTARVGMFIGAWGVADALARLIGTLLAGVGRDLLARLSGLPLAGYVGVFLIQAGLLVITLFMLRRIDVGAFRRQETLTLDERAALMGDAG